MKSIGTYLAVVLFVWLVIDQVEAQVTGRNPGHLEYENYTIAQGFPGINPRKMIQDEKGFIWIAVIEGLVRYDGYDFRLFKPDQKDPLNNIMDNLALTKDGKILCPGRNEFRFFDPTTETFHLVDYRLPSEKWAPRITDILEDHKGNIWIGTYQGVRIIPDKAKKDSQVISLQSLYHEAHFDTLLRNVQALAKNDIIHPYNLTTTSSAGVVPIENQGTEYLLISIAEYGQDGDWESFGWLKDEQGDTLWFPKLSKSVAYQYYLNRLFIERIQLPASPTQIDFEISLPGENRPFHSKLPGFQKWWGFHLIPLDELEEPNLLKDLHLLQDLSSSLRWLGGQTVTSLHKDQVDRVYVGTNRGLDIFSISEYGSKVDSLPYGFVKHFQFNKLFKGSLNSLQVVEINESEKGNICIAGFNPFIDRSQPFILEFFDPELEVFQAFQTSMPSRPKRENPFMYYYPNDLISIDKNGIWLSGAHSGLYQIPLSKGKMNGDVGVDDFFYDFTPNTGVLHIHDLLLDNNDNVWVATNDHFIFKLNNRSKQIGYVELPKSLSNQSDEGELIIGDSNGKIWVTNSQANKVYCFDLKSEQFLPVDIPPGEVGSLQVVMDDNTGGIWFGSHQGFISKYDPRSKELTRIQLADRGATYPYLQDRDGFVWAADWRSNLYKLNPSTNILKQVPSFSDSSRMERRGAPYFMYPDEDTIYIGYQGGLCSMVREEEKGKSKHQFKELLRLNDVYAATKDFRNRLWVGAWLHGLLLLDQNHNIIRSFTTEDGLLNNNIIGLFPDTKQRLWIHSHKGLQILDLKTLELSRSNYLKDIATSNNFGESYQNKNGMFFLTQGEKVYHFNLDSISIDSVPPSIVLKNFSISGSKKDANSTIAVTYIPKIDLRHRENTIAISYAGIHYDNPKEHLYAHRLVGLNDQWQEVGKERVARYNKLPPGKYIFEVKASNADGVWTDKPATLQITILPPWFWNNWSKALYAILGIGIILFGYQFQLNRRLAEAEALRLSELDQVKTRLYTNITHEFRTPLTVISGMTDQVLEDPKRWFREGLDMIKRNSKQLLQLVNQLLDLAKLESGSMKIQAIQDDIVPYIRYLGESFQAVAKVKEQRLYLLPTNKAILMDFDPDKIQSIIVNLLSNAIKFTPAEGTIYLMMDEVESKGRKLCQIKVGDSGPGISAEKQAHIFDRFYQVDASSTRTGEGTGIGLSLTKELVELLGGKIRLESVEGEGTTFIVEIPITNSAPEKAISDQLEGPSQVQAPFIRNLQALATPDDKTERQQILLVEDNADVLQYLSSCLSDQYQLEFALNGQQGIDKAVEQIPDIIISDVMMPEKDGFELLQTLKQDERTNHIPLILLTAKADIESKLQGLSYGADAYLAKPFHPGELEIRIQNLIEIRKRLQLRYQKSKDHEIDSTTINKPIMNEDPFLMKVRRNVERNMGDEKFGIPELCQALAISRTQLHRKLKAVTGQSTSYVVRSIRLERAKKLLVTTDLNVSEVGYAVGYTNSSHFTQDFRREFGKPPREYKKS